MIKPVLDPSFLPYGTVEKFRREPNAALQKKYISNSEEIPMCCFPVPTSWDYVEGMTILLIRDNHTLKQFYLDRAVTIYPGVTFGFCALGQQSVVAGDAVVDDQACVEYVDVTRDSPKLHQLHFFTLFRQVGQDGLFFRGEQHPPLELVYVEKGTLRNYCDGREFVLNPNQFLVFGPNQWHMQYSRENVQFLTISFSWDGYDFSPLFNHTFSASTEIQQSVRSLLKEYEQDLPGRDEYLNAQMKLLFLQILRLPVHTEPQKKASPVSEQAHRIIVDKAMRIVSEQIYGKLSVSELAIGVNVSASQLTALFKTYLGFTPAKYITHIRLEESKVLLGRKQLTVGEIAEQLGYSSIQHFSKQFRDWFGYTPSAYAGKEGNTYMENKDKPTGTAHLPEG